MFADVFLFPNRLGFVGHFFVLVVVVVVGGVFVVLVLYTLFVASLLFRLLDYTLHIMAKVAGCSTIVNINNPLTTITQRFR